MQFRPRPYRTIRRNYRRPRRAWIGHSARWRGFVASWQPQLGPEFLVMPVQIRPLLNPWPLIIETSCWRPRTN